MPCNGDCNQGRECICDCEALEPTAQDHKLTYEDGFAHGYEAHRAEQALEQPATEQSSLVQEPVSLPCCGYKNSDAVKWNDENKAVQCHNCGQVYVIAQEPVAFINVEKQKLEWAKKTIFHTATICTYDKIPLYNHPAKSWQGLSEDEVDDVWFSVVKGNNFENTGKYFARAIEQALKEKNT